MAYVNVAEWTPEHVAEWLRGLDDSILPYVDFFIDRNVNGCKLLLLTAGDLNESLNVTKVGQQELILEGVDQLRHLHYSLGSETLQVLALRLGCKARSLMIQLEHDEKYSSPKIPMTGSSIKDHGGHYHNNNNSTTGTGTYFDFTRVTTANTPSPGTNISNSNGDLTQQSRDQSNISQKSAQNDNQRVSLITLAGVSDALALVKILISWLDRYPFAGSPLYSSIRKAILTLSIELSSTAQRGQFVENPNEIIKKSCITLSKHCDYIVQGVADSLIIQPTYLQIVTVKKKPQENFGLVLSPATHLGMHIIDKVIFQSAAHRSGRIDEGDEIVQVDYQTVVGWTQTKLIDLMRQYEQEIILTIKKRPTHSRIMSQVLILKPYQIPMRRLQRKTSYIDTPTQLTQEEHAQDEQEQEHMDVDNSKICEAPEEKDKAVQSSDESNEPILEAKNIKNVTSTSTNRARPERLDKSVSLHYDRRSGGTSSNVGVAKCSQKSEDQIGPKEPKGPVYDIASVARQRSQHQQQRRRASISGSILSMSELSQASTVVFSQNLLTSKGTNASSINNNNEKEKLKDDESKMVINMISGSPASKLPNTLATNSKESLAKSISNDPSDVAFHATFHQLSLDHQDQHSTAWLDRLTERTTACPISNALPSLSLSRPYSPCSSQNRPNSGASCSKNSETKIQSTPVTVASVSSNEEHRECDDGSGKHKKQDGT